jgi:non-homologous end joining protein Ku
MSDDNYKKVLDQCKAIIEAEFAPCGLKDLVEERILELVREWEKRKAIAEKDGRMIGGLGAIFMDLERAVEKAKADSKKSGRDECEHLMIGLSLPYTRRGGLGYWSIRMWL